MSQQKFKKGDRVKIADDYATGYGLISRNPVKYGPWLSDHCGMTATVEYSYNDRYGDQAIRDPHGILPEREPTYSLKIDGHGSVSWFDESALKLLEHATS